MDQDKHPQLPEIGFLRLKQIIGDPKAVPPIPAIIPVSDSAWWKGVKAGIYPQPVKLSARSSAWKTEDIKALIHRLSGHKQPPPQDIEMVKTFLTTIDSEGFFTFQTFDDNKTRNDKKLARIFHGTIDQHYDELARLNNMGAGICFMVCKGDGKGRRNENVNQVRCWFVDLDHDAEDKLAKIEALPSHARPDLIVQTSASRYHTYWKVASTFPLKKFAPVLRQLADKFGGDTNVCKLPQVMRLPGFYNHKHGEPFLVRVIRHGK